MVSLLAGTSLGVTVADDLYARAGRAHGRDRLRDRRHGDAGLLIPDPSPTGNLVAMTSGNRL